MAAQVNFVEENKNFPIEIELKGEALWFTKKAAIELNKKLDSAIALMLEHEAISNKGGE
ncbi:MULTISPECIES: hypothetical protein [Shewanella]|uniref:Uncharacterized protein n=1 Tax=Shewanella oncorhynchi TaxID=2726434 RepID=A0ABX1KJH0_9GAMM|nr:MULTISPECIES: hypothetical protein [Shewanella]MCU8044416.1 hypothetical protein [Shewanella sp. SM68]MCU8048498.1 hypothetical protein [Shewanella sp. SM65]NLQ22313.1 hypothetical protein [Shewanella oncorhynchi]